MMQTKKIKFLNKTEIILFFATSAVKLFHKSARVGASSGINSFNFSNLSSFYIYKISLSNKSSLLTVFALFALPAILLLSLNLQ